MITKFLLFTVLLLFMNDRILAAALEVAAPVAPPYLEHDFKNVLGDSGTFEVKAK